MADPGDALAALVDRRGARAHFVGVGGSGMAPLAAICLARGWRVSGCDLGASDVTRQLERDGVEVLAGHDPAHLAGQDLVVASSAVPGDAPEIAAARAAGLPVVKRAELVGALTTRFQAICIAGTAGKTTTSAMVTAALIGAGADPSALVGAAVPGVGVGGRSGRSDLLVVESDEYDGSFLRFTPRVALVTNVEADHLDYYPDLAAIEDAFRKFLARVPSDGTTIVCGDDPGARRVAPAGATTYGFGEENDWRAIEARPSARGVDLRARTPDGRELCVELAVPGRHNALNALGALAACAAVGVDPLAAARGLADYAGAARRFELKGEARGVAVYDDYAHHPTKVRAMLAAARERTNGRIWCVFQPHTYHRTASLWDDFVRAFDGADALLLLDVYSPAGREPPMPEITSERLAAAMRHPNARYVPSADEAIETVAREARPGDLVLTMGAGDVTKLAPRIVERLRDTL